MEDCNTETTSPIFSKENGTGGGGYFDLQTHVYRAKKKKNLTSHATAGEILKNKMLRNYNKITTFKTAALKI